MGEWYVLPNGAEVYVLEGQPVPSGARPLNSSASGKVSASAPDGMFDAQGRYFEYRGGDWVNVPQFDNPAKAAGYRAPAQYAPQYPDSGVYGNQTYIKDPYTGAITWVAPVPGTYSDEQKRQNDLFDIAGARRFTTGERLGGQQFTAGENQLGREFTSSENALGRQFTAEENALNRALEAGQFSATLAVSQKRDQFSAEQDYQNRIRQYAQDKLSAAQAFASQVGAVDPAALPAFYAAGGGNIANALAAGASAVSDNAVMPAARTLRATREMLAPTRYSGFDDPYAAPPPPTFAAGGRPMSAQAAYAPPRPAPVVQKPVLPTAQTNLASGVVPTATNSSNFEDRPTTAAETKTWEAAIGLPDWVQNWGSDTPRYAFGTQGEPAKGTFIAGDDTDPLNPFARGAKPEKITLEDPPGPNNARAHVEPLTEPEPPEASTAGNKPKLAELFSVIGAMLTDDSATASVPRYAYGTDGYETITPTAEDRPYVDEVRRIRESVDYPVLNPYDTKYAFTPPSLRARFMAGRQTRFGVPESDQIAEQERYQLQGVGRGNQWLGV